MVGPRTRLEAFVGKMMHERAKCRMIGMARFDPDLAKEVEVLNRIVRVKVDEDRMEFESDPKHIPLLLKELVMD